MKHLGLTFLLLLTACATEPAPVSGVYSNISTSGETGDMGGVEMEVRALGPSPTVIFTRCEGGCYGGKTWPATISGDTISFSVTDDWFDENGGLSSQTTTRYQGRLQGDTLLLTSPDDPELGATLRRVPNPQPGHTEELATFG